MRNLLLIMTIALFSVSVSFGQGRVVTGTVTEADTGDPIPGANVVVKGTSTGSVTDIDGKYSVNIADEGTVLVFSFVGFVTEEIEVGNQSIINISLTSDITALSEVVVTGYGTQEKKEITSAVASVKEDAFQVGNVQDPAQLIQGKVAGLTIVKSGSNPNGGFSIRLRGLSTFNDDNPGPLVVVDGVIGADLNNVDPNDIASMDVLKDASAGAIYGTRGANGVIIVTTKSGKKGTSNVEYSGFISTETPYRLPEVLNAEEYRAFSQEIGKGTDFGTSTDWFDEITRTGVTQTHSLAISGGSESTTYRVSMNYRDINGISLNTGNDRINSRINLTHRAINNRLTLTANISGTLQRADYGNDGAFKHASIYNPTAPVRDENDPEFDIYGGYFQQVLFDYFNPVALIEQQVNEGTNKRLNMQLRGGYEIIDNLIFDMAYSYQTISELRNRYESKLSLGGGRNRNGLARKSADDFYNQLFESTLKWNGDIGNGTLDVVGGYSYQEFVNEGFHAEAGDFITDAFTFNRLGAANDFDNGLADVNSFKNSNKLIAFFGRVNFNWDRTWFVSLSGRQEGGSKFGDDNKWGFFPGVSGGVELANFINSSAVSNLKLRVSYGETGNNLQDSYLSLVVVERPEGNPSFFYNGTYVPAYGPQRNANPNLGWESKKETNIGVDYSFFGDKLYGAVDYYTRKTEALLWEFGVPQPPNLAPRTWTNVGDLRNSGLELLLNWNVVDNAKLKYTTTLTGTYYLENKIVSLSDSIDEANNFVFGIRDISNMGAPGQNNTPLVRVEEGKPMGQLWGLIYEGISEDGQWIHTDLNEDGEITGDDRAVLGNGLPDFELGWGNSFSFGNFDANIFIRGVFGHDLINSQRSFYEVPGAMVSYNLLRSARDIKNPDTGTYLDVDNALGKFSSLHVEKADYVKIQNVSIGYNFNMANSNAFQKIRVYFAGNNLATFTSYKGAEPEVRYSDDDGGVLAPGIDRRETWFQARSLALGVNLIF
jgi:TonB-linked SusC/RagA family outer membrane protein